MSRILTVSEVAAMLQCAEETVREHTPVSLPGVKFGRDWVYVESQVIASVETLALSIQQAQRKTLDDLTRAVAVHTAAAGGPRRKPPPRLP